PGRYSRHLDPEGAVAPESIHDIVFRFAGRRRPARSQAPPGADRPHDGDGHDGAGRQHVECRATADRPRPGCARRRRAVGGQRLPAGGR
nr:hypothetical protein [Tanacetum cinerariifolium]